MFDSSQLLLFITASLALNITPGQDTMYILGRTMSLGSRAGVISVLGINSGVLVHTICAAFGLSVLLATHPNLYAFVKYSGALYLIYLGCMMLFSSRESASPDEKKMSSSGRRLYFDGFVTNILNPKVALFFIAFLPQFVPANAGGPIPFLLLGLLFICTSIPWCLFLVFLAANIAAALQRSPVTGIIINRLCGMLFIALGARIALQR